MKKAKKVSFWRTFIDIFNDKDDFETMKQKMLDFVKEQGEEKIDGQSSKLIIHTIMQIKTKSKLIQYPFNSMLYYEGLGTIKGR